MTETTIDTPIARLLIVDDEAAQMTALCDVLEDAGYVTAGFTSGVEALQHLRKERFDLVLADLVMPQIDGIALLREAQAIDPFLLGIVMTGHGAVDTAIAAMQAGALDYVLKPFRLSVILPVLARALSVRKMRVEIAALQARLREHVAELEQANKELESFSYSVSHDLRAPLRAISSYSSILVQDYSQQIPEGAQRLLCKVTDNAHRMGELIEHLLHFSHLGRQVISHEAVRIDRMVAEILEELRKEDDSRAVQVRVGSLPDTVGDAVLLRQVFVNLLANAFKFTRHAKPAVVEVGSHLEGGEIVYVVRDNGAGFDMRYAAKLFGVFQRLHNDSEFEGTGIGLSLAQRIVQRHGGRIWADSAIGRGATFYFTLSAPSANDG
ncbi:MAG TPA: response regulator [Povalibacter sp.]|uniref:sensor histidine kinase n=1 Tax=Povalibacter sp. TaxID=1962978 RepID=UPI002C79FB58|nr:response regulator [Povalibacter sp.]HMN43017.1 response regulator [Povalibacter sp.]